MIRRERFFLETLSGALVVEGSAASGSVEVAAGTVSAAEVESELVRAPVSRLLVTEAEATVDGG